MRCQRTCFFTLLLTLITPPGLAEDWPQFRGPNRDGVSREENLLQVWPEDGPVKLWSVAEDLGEGYSSPAIADRLVYVTGLIGTEGVLFAFDLEGELRWKTSYGPEWTRAWKGTRATPTVVDGRIYTLSGRGVVYCHDAKSGKLIWSRDVASEFQGIQTEWGWSESLLVTGNKVICTPGGKRATMVALDCESGDLLWDKPNLGEQHAYCSPIALDHGGLRIVVNRTELFLFGVNAENGDLLWQYDCEEIMKPAKPPHVHPNCPIYHDGSIYITSGYDAGGLMFDLAEDGRAVELKWHDKELDVFLGGAMLVDGFIHGSNFAKNKHSAWVSVAWETGEVGYVADWNQNPGAILHADGRLYCFDEKTGELALVESGSGFRVVSSFRVPGNETRFFWAHPSISDGRLYVRHGKQLHCYDIADQEGS